MIQVIFAYMFNISIENVVLDKVVKELLETAFGDDACQTEGSTLLITDKADTGDVVDPSIKEVIFLCLSGQDSPPAHSLQMHHMFLPIKAAQFLRKCQDIVKKEAVPDFDEVIEIQGFRFLPYEFLLTHGNDDEKVVLTEKERNILLLLHNAGDAPVSRETMLKEIWNYVPDIETHTLETHIYRLRQKIEQDPSEPKILITEEKGYRLLG